MNTILINSFHNALISWKRMGVNILNLLLLSYFGAQSLRVGAIVLVSAAAINISLMTFIQTLVIHNVKNEDGTTLLIREVLFFSVICLFLYLLMVIASLIFLDVETRYTTVIYILFSMPTLFIFSFSSLLREFLVSKGEMLFVHKIGLNNLIVYLISNVLCAFVLWKDIPENTAPCLLMIGGYISSIYCLTAYLRKIEKNYKYIIRSFKNLFSNFGRNYIVLRGRSTAISSAYLNVIELGYFAIVGWVVVSHFPSISAYFFPSYTLLEWISGFGIGISRTLMEIYSSKKRKALVNKDIFILSLIYFVYVFFSVLIIFFSYSFFKIENNELLFSVIIFLGAFSYFDGLQLFLRGIFLGQSREGDVSKTLNITYSMSVIVLSTGAYLGSLYVFLISVFLPVVLSTFFLLIEFVKSNVK